MLKTLSSSLLALALGVGAVGAAEISDGKIVLQEVVRGTYLAFEPVSWPDDAHGVVLSIVGPGDYEAMIESGKSVPRADLAKYGKVTDGSYAYEITGGTSEKIKRKELLDNGRGNDRGYDLGSFTLSGVLVIDRGQIVAFDQSPEKGSEKTIPSEVKIDDGDKGGASEAPVTDGPKVNDSDKG